MHILYRGFISYSSAAVIPLKPSPNSIFQISKSMIGSLKECIYSSLLSLGLALNLFRVFGDFASDGDVPCIGGNSPSSSSKKHCFGGVSVAIAISWNFSESANKGKY